jgi:hypothetical protein
VLWRIADAESATLDEQEGVHLEPPRYRRIEVAVSTPPGERLACLAYQVVTPAAEHVAPSAAYLDTMLRGAAAAGLPHDYVVHIEALAARP